MRAAVYNGAPTADGSHLRIEHVPRPELQPGHVLLRVIACGVCRTDLHIVEGDLPALRPQLIPRLVMLSWLYLPMTLPALRKW